MDENMQASDSDKISNSNPVGMSVIKRLGLPATWNADKL